MIRCDGCRLQVDCGLETVTDSVILDYIEKRVSHESTEYASEQVKETSLAIYVDGMKELKPARTFMAATACAAAILNDTCGRYKFDESRKMVISKAQAA